MQDLSTAKGPLLNILPSVSAVSATLQLSAALVPATRESFASRTTVNMWKS